MKILARKNYRSIGAAHKRKKGKSFTTYCKKLKKEGFDTWLKLQGHPFWNSSELGTYNPFNKVKARHATNQTPLS